MDTKSSIREFVVKNFYVPEGFELGDETSLLDSGLVDSTGMLEVIAYLEETFGIKVADAEMVPENLVSISNLTAYVIRKT